eukprot:TRINITY_DN16487_c0_g1_i2.p1 TRINITY_DN16487_c0_g1~~TRINITY_DN16487_c0_g1_i2.p1  ORF type:complete len:312 (-),score=58.25 TRINITY_DN16487_c0_g1_i2:99-1034(-)
MAELEEAGRIRAVPFYAQYHGHPCDELRKVAASLRQRTSGIVWLAGDSSLDNKHWLYKPGWAKDEADPFEAPFVDALNGFEDVLEPPRMVRDVSYWLNAALLREQSGLACLNASVEESTIANRQTASLPDADQVIADNLESSDVVVVSVGGNDVALKPTGATQMHLMHIVTAPEDSALFEKAVVYFVAMFKDQIEAYVGKLTKRAKPRAVIVCMIYFLDEAPGDGWAESTLSRMGYNMNPGILQGVIRKIYAEATCKICVEGTQIVPLPLFEALDGKDSSDYVSRVEPSETGGQKMAEAIVAAVVAALNSR